MHLIETFLDEPRHDLCHNEDVAKTLLRQCFSKKIKKKKKKKKKKKTL